MKQNLFWAVAFAIWGQSLLAADSGSLFKGEGAVSPRLVVEMFSPWASDDYPGLIHSVDLNAITKNSNRLFCEKNQVATDNTVTCVNAGNVWAYRLVGTLKNNVYIFRTEESSETGTYVNILYRVARIENLGALKLMTVLRDVQIPNKASDRIEFSDGLDSATIVFEEFQNGAVTKVKVSQP